MLGEGKGSQTTCLPGRDLTKFWQLTGQTGAKTVKTGPYLNRAVLFNWACFLPCPAPVSIPWRQTWDFFSQQATLSTSPFSNVHCCCLFLIGILRTGGQTWRTLLIFWIWEVPSKSLPREWVSPRSDSHPLPKKFLLTADIRFLD